MPFSAHLPRYKHPGGLCSSEDISTFHSASEAGLPPAGGHLRPSGGLGLDKESEGDQMLREKQALHEPPRQPHQPRPCGRAEEKGTR